MWIVALVASMLITALLFAAAIGSIAPVMHWLGHHPGAVTALRIAPMLSLMVLAWTNHRRTASR